MNHKLLYYGKRHKISKIKLSITCYPQSFLENAIEFIEHYDINDSINNMEINITNKNDIQILSTLLEGPKSPRWACGSTVIVDFYSPRKLLVSTGVNLTCCEKAHVGYRRGAFLGKVTYIKNEAVINILKKYITGYCESYGPYIESK